MSHDEVVELLERGAGRPADEVDIGEVWATGRRRRRHKRVAATASVGVIAAAAVIVGTAWPPAPSTPVIEPATQEPAPAQGSTSQPTLRLLDEDVTAVAASATNDPSLKGSVVADADGVAAVWAMADIDGQPPALPDGTAGLVVFARDISTTCHTAADVLGVELPADGVATVLLRPRDPDAPCPGQSGREGYTAFVVAIPEVIADRMTGADVRRSEVGAPPAPTLYADVANIPVGDVDEVTILGSRGSTMTLGNDLLLAAAGGWWMAEDAVAPNPDLLATSDTGWVMTVTGAGSGDGPTSVETFRHGQPQVAIDPIPDLLTGGVTAAEWHRDEFVLLGTGSGESHTPAAALNPATGRWTTLPAVPTDAQWPWASSLVAQGNDLTAVVHARTFTLTTGGGDWIEGDPVPLNGTAFDVTSVAGRLVAVDYDGRASIRRGTNWSEPVDTGLAPSECPPTLVATGQSLFVEKCWDAATLGFPDERWSKPALQAVTDSSTVGEQVATFKVAVGHGDSFIVAVSNPDGTQELQILNAAG